MIDLRRKRRRTRPSGFFTKKKKDGTKTVVPRIARITRIPTDTYIPPYVRQELGLKLGRQRQRESWEWGKESKGWGAIREASKKEQLSAASAATVMDVSRYLAGFLSGKKNVSISTAKGFAATETLRERHVFVPPWETYNIPTVGVDKWRIFRGGVGHEAWHIRFTPVEFYTMYEQQPLKHDVMNIIEDRRIEELGGDYHKGYQDELIYKHAFVTAMRPSPNDIWSAALKIEKTLRPGASVKMIQMNTLQVNMLKAQARREALLQRVIAGYQKGKLPTAAQRDVNDCVNLIETTLPQLLKPKNRKELTMNMRRLVDYVLKKLKYPPEWKNSQPPPPGRFPGTPRSGAGASAQQSPGGSGPGDAYIVTLSPEYAKHRREEQHKSEKEHKKEIDAAVAKFFKDQKKKGEEEADAKKKAAKAEADAKKKGKKPPWQDPGQKEKPAPDPKALERAKRGDPDIVAEFNKIRKAMKYATPKGLEGGWIPVSVTEPSAKFRDHRFINDMRKYLKHWKLGRVMRLSKSGQVLTVTGFLQTKGKKPFYKIERQTVKGQKYLFLLDFSGSMHSREAEYKRAIISGIEVIDSIGGKIAVFAFGGLNQPQYQQGRGGFFRIKTFESGKWHKTDADRVAAMSASLGSTPTGQAYRLLRTYIQKHKPNITVTMTDGSPSNRSGTMEMVKVLKKKTKMVAFGIGTSALEDFGYDRHFSVSTVREIPPKLVKLIAPDV